MKNFMGYVTTTVAAAGLAALIGCDDRPEVEVPIKVRDCVDYAVTNHTGGSPLVMLLSTSGGKYNAQGNPLESIRTSSEGVFVETWDYDADGFLFHHTKCINGNKVAEEYTCDGRSNNCPDIMLKR